MGRNSSLKEQLRVIKIQEPNGLLNDLFLFQRLLLIWSVSNRILLILIEPHTASPNIFRTLVFLCMKNRRLLRHATTGGHTTDQLNVYCERSKAPKAPGLVRLIISSRAKRLSRTWCQRSRAAKSAGPSILANITMVSALTPFCNEFRMQKYF